MKNQVYRIDREMQGTAPRWGVRGRAVASRASATWYASCVQDNATRRLEDALELADLAERMVRARLRREHPGLGDEELEALVLVWLHERPGAVDGDAEGRAVELGRRS